MRAHLTVEQRRLALRLKARGLSLREIGRQVGCSHQGPARPSWAYRVNQVCRLWREIPNWAATTILGSPRSTASTAR